MTTDLSIGDVPEGIYIRTLITDVSLAEAYEQVEDPSFWDETMPPILFHYSLGKDYWSLTVLEHRRLWDWLVEVGLSSPVQGRHEAAGNGDS
jgi:hypothetical protein